MKRARCPFVVLGRRPVAELFDEVAWATARTLESVRALKQLLADSHPIDSANALRARRNEVDERRRFDFAAVVLGADALHNSRKLRRLWSLLAEICSEAARLADRDVLYAIRPLPSGLLDLADLVEDAVGHVAIAGSACAARTRLAITAECDRALVRLEGARAILDRSLARLFDSGSHPLTVLQAKDLYDGFATIAQRCKWASLSLRDIAVEVESSTSTA